MSNQQPIKLATKYKVISKYNGKSKFEFWYKINEGDIIEVYSYLTNKSVPPGEPRIQYSKVGVIIINGDNFGQKFVTGPSQIAMYLDRMELETIS